MNEKRWADTGCLKSKPKEIDQKSGVITGVKVCSAGEAKGHGFFVDGEFVNSVADHGAAAKNGLKARFGHPNMCSEALGTYIGRFKNFSTGTTIRDDGSEAECCFADLHLSDTAKTTPNGDLHSYIMDLAANEADVFGASIVFVQGPNYRKTAQGEKVYPYDVDGRRNEAYSKESGPDYVECKNLLACDCVDDPAANDGMFSAFSGETVAGQITEFLDLHPQVFALLTDNPEVMGAICQYGDKFDEFLAKYQEHRVCREDRDDKTEQYKEATMPDVKTVVESEVVEKNEELSAEEVVEVPEKKELSTEEAIEAALQKDRKRQAEIRELGAKFGFSIAAEQFAFDGRSVDDFRAHILAKSPDEWVSSLSIKNPSVQKSEQEFDDSSEGADAVEKIKENRKAKFRA